MVSELIEISENNDEKPLDIECEKDEKPFKFKDKTIDNIEITKENEKSKLKTNPLNYYIGLDWLKKTDSLFLSSPNSIKVKKKKPIF